MAEATNATSAQLELSIVYYDPAVAAAQAVADSVATMMGGLAVEAVPTPVPIEGGALDGSGVVVMLGTAQADKTLEELSTPAAATPETGTAPAVAGTGDHRRSRHDDRLTVPGAGQASARSSVSRHRAASSTQRFGSDSATRFTEPIAERFDPHRCASPRLSTQDSTDPTIAAHGSPASRRAPRRRPPPCRRSWCRRGGPRR